MKPLYEPTRHRAEIYLATLDGVDIYIYEGRRDKFAAVWGLGQGEWDCTPWDNRVPQSVQDWCEAYKNLMS